MDNPSAAPKVAYEEADKHSRKSDVSCCEDIRKTTITHECPVDDQSNDIYADALARYPNDESIDDNEERKVRRKLDAFILPVLGVCYFFYYVDKTTLLVPPLLALR